MFMIKKVATVLLLIGMGVTAKAYQDVFDRNQQIKRLVKTPMSELDDN